MSWLVIPHCHKRSFFTLTRPHANIVWRQNTFYELRAWKLMWHHMMSARGQWTMRNDLLWQFGLPLITLIGNLSFYPDSSPLSVLTGNLSLCIDWLPLIVLTANLSLYPDWSPLIVLTANLSLYPDWSLLIVSWLVTPHCVLAGYISLWADWLPLIILIGYLL